jgi:ribosome-associated protein
VIKINRDIGIPEHEVSYRFSRSGKPGGQKVNKTSSRVTLLFDVKNSESLSEAQRALIGERLASRINNDGILGVVSQKYRTQSANREAALERFKELLKKALKRKRRRKPTAVPQDVQERRLRAKKLRSRLKQERAKQRTQIVS